MDTGEEDKQIDMRRSSRSNFGHPPKRYGYSESPKILSSTVHTGSGLTMSRTTMVAPPRGNARSEDDSVSQASSHSVDLLDYEISELEESIYSKLETMKSLAELRKQELTRLQSELKEEQNADYESDEASKEHQFSLIPKSANVNNFVPTPKPRTKLPFPRSLVLPQQLTKPVAKGKVADDEQFWDRKQEIRGRGWTIDETGGPVQQTFPHYDSRESSGKYFGTERRKQAVQPPEPSTNVDVLAQAFVKVLQFQTSNTETFVARQSASSQLPQFSGNPLEWPLFYHHYVQSTRDCGFSPQQNMARLEKSLRGEARRTVRSLMIIPSNTDAVMSRLEQRFGRPEIVIQALTDIARKTPALKEGKLSSIVEFANAVSNLVTTVKTLDEPTYLQNPHLLQELVEKLPDNLKMMWGMTATQFGGRGNLVQFSDWIDMMADAASAVTIPKFNLNVRKEENMLAVDVEEDNGDPTTQEEKSEARSNSRLCLCCEKDDHWLTNCELFRKMSIADRLEVVKSKNLCFRCLRPGHSARNCRGRNICRVEGCGRRHHTFLHDAQSNPRSNEEPIKETNGVCTALSTKTLLRIVCVKLHGPKGSMIVNALLDGGSSVTLLASSVAKKLGLTGPTDPLRIKWTNGTRQEDYKSKKVDCQVGPVDENTRFNLRRTRTVDKLDLPPQRTDIQEIVKMYPHLQKTKFKYLPGEAPTLLIGQPHATLIVAREVIENEAADDEPILSRTKLGWTLHGPCNGEDGYETAYSCTHESDDGILHNLVKESFSLDSLGVKQVVSLRTREDELAEEKMIEVTRRVDGRWETGLLWRMEPVNLPSSRGIAEKRLHGILRKLAKDGDLKKQYNDKIQHYIDKKYARRLTSEELNRSTGKEWYLPHFDRTHPNKPGKIRIVFDAASRSNGVSLNDHLLTGPDLLVSLPGLLVKFRQKNIAISGDITEMFHQVQIRSEDCSAQRFLWKEEGKEEPTVFQLEVMMFGSVCSPFCAQFVKNANAKEFEEDFPMAAAAIIKNHYMDDWLQSVDTEDEAIRLVQDVAEVHSRGGMEIGKWISNSPKLLRSVCGSNSALESKNLAEWSEVPTERALGLHWIPEEDLFTFRVNVKRAGAGIATGEKVPTKREVLRLIMLVWDPLGFIGHYLVKARILLQGIWRMECGWDDEIPTSLHKKWLSWIRLLPELAKIRIPRCYSKFGSSSKDVSLHIFCDSSELAGCCVGYLRIVEEEETKVAFVMSRSRVAPLKPCSIPRLELTAALLASRMGKFLRCEFEIIIHSMYYWTDSMTVLRWIRSEARKYQTFVAGRVGEIQENSDAKQWRWVPTALNPADDGTREGKTDITGSSRWWQGPEFLKRGIDEWPLEKTEQYHEEVKQS